MKHAAIWATLLLSLSSQAGELQLELHGKGLSGQTLKVEVFDSAASFLSDKVIRGIRAHAQGDSTRILMQNLPAGKYAVAVFADRNQNGKLDRNIAGMPTEQYGFSNDARRLFGPPSFADAAFELGDGAVVQSIHLQ